MIGETASSGATLAEQVEASRWRAEIGRALTGGARAASLHAGGGELHVVLVEADGSERMLSCRPDAGEAPSVIDLVPSLGWDEREAHDLDGLRFDGHDPLRPLVDHTSELERWTVPVRGHGPYQVAVGPIHAGVIESGHFRFHVVGERILHVDVRLFYKHRGLERASKGQTLAGGMPYVQRACAACAVANTVAYATACERATGLEPSEGLREIRTVLLELERLYNHLHDIGQLCAGVGFASGTMAFLSLKERAQRLNERLTGHRFLFGSVALGASPVELDRDDRRMARDALRGIADTARTAWREVAFNGSVQDRLDAVGVVTSRAARRLGTVGPAARASGVTNDVRTESPHLAYQGFVPAAANRPSGDVRARLAVRAAELESTACLLDRLLGRPPTDARALPGGAPGRFGVGRVESPRGETVCVVEQREGVISRLRLRTGSYANWPSVAHAAAGNLLPDFPLVNKSFELCYACADR